MWTPRRGEAQVGTTPTESGELENVPKALGKSANQRLCARSYPPGKTNATRNSCFLKIMFIFINKMYISIGMNK